MRVRVTRDHDHIVSPRVTIAFKAGREYTTKREWGDALVAAGAAEEITPPPREDPADAADDAPRG